MGKTIADIQKKFGEGAIFKLGDAGLDIKRLTTGFIGLDRVLGGGMPIGRIVEIYGQESTGKTTICQHVVAEAQKADMLCAYIDMEHALDPAYAKACGVDINNLYISQPDTGEQALEIAQILIESGAFGVVVIDSVAALVPRAELEGDMGDSHMGLQARLMGQAMRKLSPLIKKSNTILIFINQIRSTIGGWGNNETTSGGNALKFYASIRLDMRKIKTIKSANEAVGDIVRIRVKKNKTAAPFQEIELTSMYGHGFSREHDLLNEALVAGIVEKRGAWFSFGETKLQGENGMTDWLKDEENYNTLYEALNDRNS